MGKAVNMVYSSTSSEGMKFIDGLISNASDDYSVRGLGLEVMFGRLERRPGKDLFSAQAAPGWSRFGLEDLPSTASLDASTGLKVTFLSPLEKKGRNSTKAYSHSTKMIPRCLLGQTIDADTRQMPKYEMCQNCSKADAFG
jgi:hypothetical protein